MISNEPVVNSMIKHVAPPKPLKNEDKMKEVEI